MSGLDVCLCGHVREEHNDAGCCVVEVFDEVHRDRNAVDPREERAEPCDCPQFLCAQPSLDFEL